MLVCEPVGVELSEPVCEQVCVKLRVMLGVVEDKSVWLHEGV